MQFQSVSAFHKAATSLSVSACSPATRVASVVAGQSKVPISLIFNRSRCRANIAQARQLAMYLTHVVMGESLTAVGAAFGRDRTTVSYACALIEDQRDNRDFDSMVCALEELLENDGKDANG